MSDDEKNFLSATALAKKYDIAPKEMFVYLTNHGLIEKRGDVWSLTNEGVAAGGKFIKGKPFGKYIVWPEDLKLDINNEKLITVSMLSKKFGIQADDMLAVLAGLGWIHKGPGGVFLMLAGQELGGMQDEDTKKGITIVRWPESIVDSDLLCRKVEEMGGILKEKKSKASSKNTVFKKQQCTAIFRTEDGHFVNTEVEAIVDNWLYGEGVVHAFEKCHDGNIVSTFFLPDLNFCIDLESPQNQRETVQLRKKYYIEKGYDFLTVKEDLLKDIESLQELLKNTLAELSG